MRRSSMNTRSPETSRSSRRGARGRVRGVGVGLEARDRAQAARGAGRAGDRRRTHAERPCAGAARRDRPALPAGIDRLAPGDRFGDRADREVAQREVGGQRAATQRLDVNLPRAIARHDAPAGEVLGELEAGGATGGGADDRAGRGLRERRRGRCRDRTWRGRALDRAGLRRPAMRECPRSAARDARSASSGTVSLTTPARRRDGIARRTRADSPQVIS